ncbi:MAG: hypothetical protein FJ375_00795 [Pelagibacterales bacterium]|nr:hypothetical protein [Pelagibacterales bacterium]
MKKFVGYEGLFYAIFSENNIQVKEKHNLPYYNIAETKPYMREIEINLNGQIEQVELYVCPMPTSMLNAIPTKKLTEFELDLYMNPPENSIVIYDRWIFQRYIDFIFRQYGISHFDKFIKRYKDKNIKVIFNFAFFEPNEYESLNYFLMKYDYSFDCIKLTDYELFDRVDKFVFSKIFNIFHIVGDLMSFEIDSLFRKNLVPSIHNLFVAESIKNPDKLYSHLTLKPRPHRINFINKLYDLDIIDYGYCTLNKIMYDEYQERIDNGLVYSTDNCLMQNKWLYDYFKNMDYRGYDYYSKKMKDILGKNFWSHLRHYFENKEYKKSYIDVIGETHILFDTLFSYFSEKSYYPILTEKFFIIYGGNRFYEMLEEFDCYNCLDLFGLDKTYYQIENPYEQGDIIANKLKELIDKKNSGEFDIEKYYQENKYKLINTKQKILSKYTNSIDEVKKFILK